MFKILIASTLTLVIISSCANRPEGITAQHVAHEKYTGLTCEGLVTQLIDARYKLSALLCPVSIKPPLPP